MKNALSVGVGTAGLVAIANLIGACATSDNSTGFGDGGISKGGGYGNDASATGGYGAGGFGNTGGGNVGGVGNTGNTGGSGNVGNTGGSGNVGNTGGSFGGGGSGGSFGGGGSGGSFGGGGSGGSFGGGGSGGGTTTLPAGCASSLITVSCNPVTNSPCGAGEACDLGDDGTGALSLECFPPPNTQLKGQNCTNSAGPYCAGKLHCDVNPEAGTGTCKTWCCSSSDCPGGTCVQIDPSFGTMGVCSN